MLLAHFANREITDHMDRLPRDIAQERMHHDIVQLLDEYNTVRSPQSHVGPAGHHLTGGHTLSPLMCPPSSFLPSLKNASQGKKSRRPGAKGLGAGHTSSLKDSVKARNKKLTLDMQSALLESSVTLSPVDSLDSPRGGASNAGYVTNPTSPAAMPSPGLFHTSMSVPGTPMVHSSMMDGSSGPFAVSMAGLNDLADAGLSLQSRMSMQGVQAAHGCILNPAQMAMGLGIVNPVSVPFDWHSRIPASPQCGPPMVSMVHPAGGQGSMHPQTPSAMQPNLLIHQQQVFRSSQQPMLQPTPVSSAPSLSPVKLPSIAEQQQIHSHTLSNQQSLASMGSSTPPTPQQPQNPPAFYQQQQQQQGQGQPQQQPQPPPAPQPSQGQAAPPQTSQAPSTQVSSSTGLEDYPTPPSQHSYTSAMDATPKHYLHLPNEHPYLTPSPESPEPWSSPSPHCAPMSDWSDSSPSPAVTGPAQTQIPHVPEPNGKMQVFA